MESTIKELLKFVQIGARLDLKAVALENILGLTGTKDGIASLATSPPLLHSLVALLDDASYPVAKDAALCLINVSASDTAAEVLVRQHAVAAPPLQAPFRPAVERLLRFALDESSRLADPCCMVLSNLTRPARLVDPVIEQILAAGCTFERIICVFTKQQHSTVGCRLDYLGALLSNLSQSGRVRRFVLDRERCVVQRLLPFTEYGASVVKRGGAVGTLKNCCFEVGYHGWLLGPEVDILPRLLLPLAGAEEFDEEDNERLPLDLQYLGGDKQREEDPDIRVILIEAITQLCAVRKHREFIREKNAYVILRELHKWEKDKKVIFACENLVDILIRTEDEIGEDNLKEKDVPDEMREDFIKADEEFLNEKD